MRYTKCRKCKKFFSKGAICPSCNIRNWVVGTYRRCNNCGNFFPNSKGSRCPSCNTNNWDMIDAGNKAVQKVMIQIFKELTR